MKMIQNMAIMRMASELECDYLFALGLYFALGEMEKSGDIDIDERTVYQLGYMSRDMSRKLSRLERDKLRDMYRNTKRDIKRDIERDRMRDWRERKRMAPSSPPSPTPLSPLLSPQEKESEVTPPVLLRNTAPEGGRSSKGNSGKKHFVKPTIEELRAYALEIDYNLRVEAFMDYYDGNGWMVGKNHMKDWKATVRQWKRRDEERGIDVHARHPEFVEQDIFAGNTPEEIALIEQLARDGQHWG